MLCSPNRTRWHVDEASGNFVLPVHWWWGSGYHSDLISTTRSHYRRVTFVNGAISTAKRYWHTGNRPIKTWTWMTRQMQCSSAFPTRCGLKCSNAVCTCSCSLGNSVPLFVVCLVFVNTVAVGGSVISCLSQSLKAVLQSWLHAMSKTQDSSFDNSSINPAFWDILFLLYIEQRAETKHTVVHLLL